MGLLDFQMPGLDTPQGQGLLSAAFSLMSAKKLPGQKGAFAGALGDAGQQYLQSSNASQDQMMKRKYLDNQMQAQQMQLEAARRQQAEQERVQAAVRNAFSPMGASQAMAGGGGPTSANAARMGQMPQVDPLQVLRDGGPKAFEEVMRIQGALNPKQKFSTAPQYDQQGRAFILAEDGTVKYLDGIKQRDELISEDLGGTKGFRTKYSPDMVGSVDKTMTFGDKIAQGQLGVSQANLGLARQRLAFDRAGGADGAKPQLVDGQWVYRPDAQNPQGRVVPVDGIAPKPLTESQGASAMFGRRASEAHQQLSALEDSGGGRPGTIKRVLTAATPGLGMGLDESMGTAMNWTQSKNQQLSEQAQKNFLTAVLRKESGASISPTEFATGGQIYFPQPGDSKEVIAQKRQARESAIAGLSVQAGPGSKFVTPQSPRTGSWDAPKFLGFEK